MCKACLFSMLIAVLALVLYALPSYAPAAGCGGKHHHEQMGVCPVSGKPGSAAHTMDVGSKTLYFCDAMCKKEFRKRPLHYLKRMRMKKVGKSCPVVGKCTKTKCCGVCKGQKAALKKSSCGGCPYKVQKAKKACATSSCSDFKKRYFYE